ncbi:MAG: hypothetical protein WC972_02525 [Trueperaceae bacterium]
MTTYNGHPSWEHWNVSLWLGNDEGLYRLAQDVLSRHRSARDAAADLITQLEDAGITQTPDGAAYTTATVAHALRFLRD